MSDDDFQQNASDDPVVNDPSVAPLPRDDHPFNEPDDIPKEDQWALNRQHPATDNKIQVEEEYDEGLSGAAEAGEPNIKDTVTGYDPNKDKRNQ